MSRPSRRFASLITSLLALGVCGRVFGADAGAPIFQPGDLLGVVGDSITEQKIYSVFIEDYLLMCKPVSNVRTMQFGWSGDTTWGFFKDKIDGDVLRFKPTVVTTCFGMNDGGYNKMTPETADHYRYSTQSIIDEFKAKGVRTIILGSPGCVGTQLNKKPVDAEEYNKTLASLRDIDKDLAARNSILFADVFTPMMDVRQKAMTKYGPKYQLCGPDGIHPSLNGHLVMAYAFLKAMGFNGDIGTIGVDMGSGAVTTTDGHKNLSSTPGKGSIEAEFESSRYPFCFTGDPTTSAATSGVIEFFPFNQELNRFMLVVKNAPADKMKVTWGSTSKEFSSAELARGINLSEFIDNPFNDAFFKVNKAVFNQQNNETQFIKNFVFNIPAYKQLVEEKDGELLEKLADSGGLKDKSVFEAAAGLVKPVRHTIKIEVAK
jgi:lysophospholipase L1-like esterase